MPLEALGANYHIPDLNVPTFETFTLSAAIQTLHETVETCTGDIALIGSSLGALVALHYMDTHANDSAKHVKKAVFLAPAFDFGASQDKEYGEINWREQWQKDGTFSFFQPASGQKEGVHYGMLQDIERYNSWIVPLKVPLLIYHGRNDTVVPYDQSLKFADNKPNVSLYLLMSDHQLLDKTDEILTGIVSFLGL
jgi:uncharacterized protein